MNSYNLDNIKYEFISLLCQQSYSDELKVNTMKELSELSSMLTKLK